MFRHKSRHPAVKFFVPKGMIIEGRIDKAGITLVKVGSI